MYGLANKRGIKTFGLLLAVIFSILVFAGCGASNKSANSSRQVEPAVSDSGGAVTEDKGAPGYVGSVGGGESISQDVSNAILAERKVIRSANISLEIEDFDEAYGQINNLILGIGYIQSTNINTDKAYISGKTKLIRSGSIVIRVDKDRFDKTLNNLKGIGDVMNWNINGEDVTSTYVDIESRLRLLKLEESKIEEYLKKLTDLDKIFKVESQLTDIRYQIESLTGNLNKMSDLVALSTITINLKEKYPDSDTIKTKSYLERLIGNLTGSLKSVVKFIGELVIFLVAALPFFILLGIAAFAAFKVYKRSKKRIKQEDIQKKTEKTEGL